MATVSRDTASHTIVANPSRLAFARAARRVQSGVACIASFIAHVARSSRAKDERCLACAGAISHVDLAVLAIAGRERANIASATSTAIDGVGPGDGAAHTCALVDVQSAVVLAVHGVHGALVTEVANKRVLTIALARLFVEFTALAALCIR